jgi:hypothetical protein
VFVLTAWRDGRSVRSVAQLSLDVVFGIVAAVVVTAHSGNGSVTVGLPNTTDAYRLAIHSGNGSTSTSVRTDPTSTRQITASSGNGSVTVRYGPG